MGRLAKWLFLPILAMTASPALATRTLAQSGSVMSASLEAILSSGDTVFIGHILGDNAVDDKTRELTVQVDETLKGKPDKTVTLRHDANGITNSLPSYLGQDIKLLWVVKSGDPNTWTVLDTKNAPANFNSRPAFPQLPILGMDLKPIRIQSELIGRARHFLASITSPPTLCEVVLPGAIPMQARSNNVTTPFMLAMMSTAKRDRPGLVAARVLLPIVPALEPVVRRMIEEPESILPPLEAIPGTKLDPKLLDRLHEYALEDLRLSGARLISDFKSDRNVKLLEGLLTDKTVRPRLENPPGPTPSNGFEYPMRRIAYETLTVWGVKVDKPVIGAPAPGEF